MGKRPVALNTNFASMLYPEPKQWMKIVGEELGFEICEITTDVFDPLLREPTKTVKINNLLELCDDNHLQIFSMSVGQGKHVNNLLLHPNFGNRFHSIEYFENLIDVSAGLDIYSVGGYMGTPSDLTSVNITLDYLYDFFKDALKYLTNVAYEAGLSQFHLQLTNYDPEFLRIIESVINAAKIPVALSIFTQDLLDIVSSNESSQEVLLSLLNKRDAFYYILPDEDVASTFEQLEQFNISISDDLIIIYTNILHKVGSAEFMRWSTSMLNLKNTLEEL